MSNSFVPALGGPETFNVYVRFSAYDLDDAPSSDEAIDVRQEQALKDFCREHGFCMPTQFGSHKCQHGHYLGGAGDARALNPLPPSGSGRVDVATVLSRAPLPINSVFSRFRSAANAD